MEIGDLATWVASVGTVLAVLIALGQPIGQRLVNAGRRRRADAEAVFAWSPGRSPKAGATLVDLTNSPSRPIYQVVVWIVLLSGDGPRRGEDWMSRKDLTVGPPFAILDSAPPGFSAFSIKDAAIGEDASVGLEIGFTDAAGRHWIRRSGGSLERIKEPAPKHYGLGPTLTYTRPRSGHWPP